MKKLLAFLLAMAMIVTLVACTTDYDDTYDPDDEEEEENDKDDDKDDKKDSEDKSSSVDSSVDISFDDSSVDISFDDSSVDDPVDDLEYASQLGAAYDMNGYEFNILQRWFGYGKQTIDFEGEVIWIDDENGKLSEINQGKAKALDYVQSAYNCVITGEISTDAPFEIRTMILDDIAARTGDYDFCFETPYYYTSLVQDGNLVNLKDLGINFYKPWWDANAVNDLSICNELYFAMGDINTYDNDGTVVCFFNKTLFNKVYPDKDYKELYELASRGDWTFDKLKEYAEGVGKDIDGSNTRDEKDQYGLMTETSNIYTHLIASGNKFVDKDANDIPQLVIQNQNAYDVVEDTVEFYLKSNDVLVADLEQYVIKYDGQDVYEYTIINGFKEGRGLFYIAGLVNIPYLADMDDDYGILPMPKYGATQNRYYHTVSYAASSAVFVPDNGRNFEDLDGKYLATILDALGAYSKDLVTPAYYNKLLKRDNTPDAESAEMLDIIFATRSYDPGAIYSKEWGDLLSMVNVLDDSFSANIDIKLGITVRKMQLFVDTLLANK